MKRKSIGAAALLVLLCLPSNAQDARTSLEKAANAMGAANLNTIQYSGRGSVYALGQSASPNDDWPRFNAPSYSCAIDYRVPAEREEWVRTQALNPPRGGGLQPVVGEQRQTQLVSGNFAWSLNGDRPIPQPAAAVDRALMIWLTPFGFLQAAQQNSATAKAQTIGGRRLQVVSFMVGRHKVNGYINDQSLVEKVETWIDNPVLGDMPVESTYSDYRDFSGVKFPAHIIQRQGGHPVLDLTVDEVKANAPVEISVPEAVRQASGPPPVKVDAQELAEGVYFLAGGSHNSVAVEFKDYVVMVEGPLNQERSLAVMAETRRLFPGKPIRYLVNTHHHFDHSGGVRAYAAQGAIVITNEINRQFFEQMFRAPHTLNPDEFSSGKRQPKLETMGDTRTITDGTRRLEIYHIRGNAHNDGILMAYLPAEKILIEADVFTPAAPSAPPEPPNNFAVNFNENLQRLKLDVRQIASLHGRVVTMDYFREAMKTAAARGAAAGESGR